MTALQKTLRGQMVDQAVRILTISITSGEPELLIGKLEYLMVGEL